MHFLLFHGAQNEGEDQVAKVKELLNVVKDIEQDMFSQSCIFSLQQLADDPILKEKVFNLL